MKRGTITVYQTDNPNNSFTFKAPLFVEGIKKTGYPIIRITKQIIGKAKQRVIGYVKNNTYVDIDIYKTTLTDSKTNEIWMEFGVTRDAFAVLKENSYDKYVILTNFAFEPKDKDINHYAAKFMEAYPYKPIKNDTPALKLIQKGSEVIHASSNKDAISLGYRSKEDVAKGVMIHVGGVYKNENFEDYVIAASEGCFGIVNNNNSSKNPSDELTIKIMGKIRELSNNSVEQKGHIRVIIEKREGNEIPNKIKHYY